MESFHPRSVTEIARTACEWLDWRRRTYLTRHGIGPFPTHDPSLDVQLLEPHNSSAGWQGPFRRGHPDAVLLRNALEAIGPLSGLLISHLDVFDRGVSLKWCEEYSNASRLPPGELGDLAHQEKLTKLLEAAEPRYAKDPIDSESAWFARLASITAGTCGVMSYVRASTHAIPLDLGNIEPPS